MRNLNIIILICIVIVPVIGKVLLGLMLVQTDNQRYNRAHKGTEVLGHDRERILRTIFIQQIQQDLINNNKSSDIRQIVTAMDNGKNNGSLLTKEQAEIYDNWIHFQQRCKSIKIMKRHLANDNYDEYILSGPNIKTRMTFTSKELDDVQDQQFRAAANNNRLH